MVQFLWENVLKKKSDENNMANFLGQSFLFKDLGSKEMEFVTSIVHLRHYEPGEKIFKQGDPGVGMYLIFKGSIDIIVHDPSKGDSPEAQGVAVTRLEKGDFFGELSLIEDPSIRSATAVSKTQTTLIGFFKPDLMQVIERNPVTGNKISMRLAEILGKRLRETTEKVSELAIELSQTNLTTERANEKHFTS